MFNRNGTLRRSDRGLGLLATFRSWFPGRVLLLILLGATAAAALPFLQRALAGETPLRVLSHLLTDEGSPERNRQSILEQPAVACGVVRVINQIT